MRIACYPNTEQCRDDLMLRLMNAAIERQGGEFVRPGSDHLEWGWLWSSRKCVDVIHLHWTVWHYQRSSRGRSALALAKFIAKLALIRLIGYRLVWTMHNVYPHERVYPILDLVGRLAVAQLAHGVIVHCNQGRVELRRRFFRKRNVYMAYLGHFVDVHPRDIGRDEARERLGLGRADRVLLFFGAIRPYKGLGRLMQVFTDLDTPDLRLVVAGWALPDHLHELESLAAADPRIRLFPEWISAEDAQIYFEASDLVVLPFVEILTSASALTAMSFGKPVVAPAMGCLPELITEGCGILYDPGAEDGLTLALLEALRSDLSRMGATAHAQVRQLDWDPVGRVIMDAYQGR